MNRIILLVLALVALGISTANASPSIWVCEIEKDRSLHILNRDRDGNYRAVVPGSFYISVSLLPNGNYQDDGLDFELQINRNIKDFTTWNQKFPAVLKTHGAQPLDIFCSHQFRFNWSCGGGKYLVSHDPYSWTVMLDTTSGTTNQVRSFKPSGCDPIL